MPELPDVENFKRIFAENCLSKPIDQVDILRQPGQKVRTLQNATGEEFREGILGAAAVELERRGKFLITYLSNGNSLVFHFMLSGALAYVPPGSDPPPEILKSARLRFAFRDGSSLWFGDRRNMGRVFLLKGRDFGGLGVLARIGVEPLSSEFTRESWKEILRRNPDKTIKDLMTDQEEIAGIGNVYSDEILREAGVRPMRLVRSLSGAETQKIFENIPKVLKKGIETLASGEPAHFLEWRNRKAQCPGCGGPVAAVRRGASHSYYCPHCQK